MVASWQPLCVFDSLDDQTWPHSVVHPAKHRRTARQKFSCFGMEMARVWLLVYSSPVVQRTSLHFKHLPLHFAPGTPRNWFRFFWLLQYLNIPHKQWVTWPKLDCTTEQRAVLPRTLHLATESGHWLHTLRRIKSWHELSSSCNYPVWYGGSANPKYAISAIDSPCSIPWLPKCKQESNFAVN